MTQQARKYAPGIGEAVANRTINRDIRTEYQRKQNVKARIAWDSDHDLEEAVAAWAKSNGYIYESFTVDGTIEKGMIDVTVRCTARIRKETWGEVAERVAKGNVGILDMFPDFTSIASIKQEYEVLARHISKATILTSGRHLQHGDETQKDRNMEVFTNCSTAAASFVTFYLLLNGSGVGRSYDDDMMVVDWSKMPIVVPVIDHNHGDAESGEIHALTRSEAEHLYKFADRVVYEVPDTREGWAKAVEQIEVMAWGGCTDDVLIIDFSKIRPRGAPIVGMQDRPSSGPGPLMNAMKKMNAIRGSEMRPWRATMFIDHYLAECVLVGGARRAARMSTKYWKDKGVLEFIELKRGGHLWSSNNSVTVDQEFWTRLSNSGFGNAHAQAVFDVATYSAYHDRTGEPGLINQDKLEFQGDTSVYLDGNILNDSKYQIDATTRHLMSAIVKKAMAKQYQMIVNPCGEIPLIVWGGYCILTDVVPYHAESDEEAEEAFRVATRFLIRVNLMDSLYKREVDRTNRIGVSMTGIHEYALKRFGLGWNELVDEEKSQDFWQMIARFKAAVDDEAIKYAAVLGVEIPHTNTTIKPAGTTSKLFGLTEGAHLPPMREYMRWVQFINEDPLVPKYAEMGYPIRKLRTYGGTTIVGFPTRPEICKIVDDPSQIVTAPEASPADQYEWIRLLEKYWLGSGNTGNQISYTLKLDTREVSFDEYVKTLKEYQPHIKCCTIMPFDPDKEQVYEYLPESPILKEDYERILEAVNSGETEEGIDMETLECETGACPI